MRRGVATMLAALACWVGGPQAEAAVEGQTFVGDVFSLQAGSLKATLGFLVDGVVGIDIEDAADAVGDYTQNGTEFTLVRCQFEDEDGVSGRFTAIANDPKQADPAGTDPATIFGFGFTAAGDLFFFSGEELITTTSSSTDSDAASSSGRRARRR